MCIPNPRLWPKLSATGWFDGKAICTDSRGRLIAPQCLFFVDIPLCTDGDRRGSLSQTDLVREAYMPKQVHHRSLE